MKKVLSVMAVMCGIWAGTHSLQMNFAAAQNGAFTTTIIIPLTNQAPFTNTLLQPTALSTIQLGDVVTLLLRLQTNIEETLPVLDLMQSNAFVISVSPTNRILGFAEPITSNPADLLKPTGSDAPQTSLAVKIGTNTFGIDAPTLQALFILRGNLQQALVTLQKLNGTTPPPQTAPSSPFPPSISFIPPPVTNFSPGPLTNNLAVPITNMSPF